VSDDASSDDGRRAYDRDTHTAVQIVELRGAIHEHGAINKRRFDEIDKAVDGVKTDVSKMRGEFDVKIDKHEEQEKADLAPHLDKLDTVRRLVWIAVGSIVILSAVIAFGLSVIQKSIFGGGP